MQIKKLPAKAFRAAFPLTLPVLAGYGFLGVAFGLLLSARGYGPVWAFLLSVFVYGGSIQFLAVGLLAAGFDPLSAFLLSVTVNARHIFYGLSMLSKYRGLGRLKHLLVFLLTDETFSVVLVSDPPEGVPRGRFYFWISFLDYTYWVLASTVGGFLGGWASFDSKGLDFVLTALFVAILTEQWQTAKNRVPAAAGIGVSVFCIVVFGQEHFLLPALGGILAVLTLARGRLEGGGGHAADAS